MLQLSKAVIGLCLALVYVAAVGLPNAAVALALAGFLVPAVLAVLAYTRLPLSVLESCAEAVFAVLIAYLAALSGGARSPLVIWLVLVPAEAALSGGRAAVMRAGIAAVVALAGLAWTEMAGLLPAPHLIVPTGMPVWPLYVVPALAAVIQSAFIAAAAQGRQRRADQAAVEGASMYRFLADHALDLVTRHSADGRIRFASPAAHALVGHTPEALVGLEPATLVHPEDVKALQVAFVEASYFGRPSVAEVRLKRCDDVYIWAEMRCHPAAHAKDVPAEIIAVTRDISDRKAHERALINARDLAEQASRAKSNFLANMSHELRTPLNAIIGFSEVMGREMFGPIGVPRYNEYVQLIHESGNHLLELINGILDMSKIEAGKFTLTEEIFSMEESASAALAYVKIQADHKDISLALEIAEDCRQIYADRRAIKQMLVNLLSNGVKFTPRGGTVVLRVSQSSNGVELVVRDTGIGISPEDLARLGRPFEQAEGVHIRTQEGTGLGLALVKAFAVLHNGELRLESRVGEGTLIRVILPHAGLVEGEVRRLPVPRQLRHDAA